LLIVDLQMREIYGILKEANPHFFALFSVEFHPITGAPRGDVLRLVWIVDESRDRN